MRYVVILAAVAASLSACSSGAGSGAETGGATPDRNLITAEEIAGLRNVHNAYEAVQQLRPLWLTPRPSRSTADRTPRVPVAFVDRMELGAPTVMRTIGIAEVLEIRFIDEREAVNRFGTRYNTGIIQIVTR